MIEKLNEFPWFLIATGFIFFFGWVIGYVYSYGSYRQGKQKSLDSQRSIVKGMISEQFAPYLKDFPVDLSFSEARFMGAPVDFIVYKGLNNKKIEEVVFVEVKSGAANLNETERSLKDAIDNRRVRWVTSRIHVE